MLMERRGWEEILKKIITLKQQKKYLEVGTSKKNEKLEIGGIFTIPLPNRLFGYGRILEKSNIAVYDYFTTTVENEIYSIVKKPVLFIISIYDDIIKKGEWKIIGKESLDEYLKIIPMKFIQDALSPNNFSLYNPNTGEIIQTTKERCVGLERSSVWDSNHVEQRILDHINGVPNQWLERNKRVTS